MSRENFSVCWSSKKTVSSRKQMQASMEEERQVGMVTKSGKDKETFAGGWKQVKNPSSLSKNRKLYHFTYSLPIVYICMHKVKPGAHLHYKHIYIPFFLIQIFSKYCVRPNCITNNK